MHVHVHVGRSSCSAMDVPSCARRAIDRRDGTVDAVPCRMRRAVRTVGLLRCDCGASDGSRGVSGAPVDRTKTFVSLRYRNISVYVNLYIYVRAERAQHLQRATSTKANRMLNIFQTRKCLAVSHRRQDACKSYRTSPATGRCYARERTLSLYAAEMSMRRSGLFILL